LETLFATTAYHSSKVLKNRLHGLLNNLVLSRNVFIATRTQLEQDTKKVDTRGPMLFAIELCLAEPFLRNTIDYNALFRVWQQSKIISAITTRLYMAGSMISANDKATDTATLIESCRTAETLANALILQIGMASRSLDG
jgi:hypothetical protein